MTERKSLVMHKRFLAISLATSALVACSRATTTPPDPPAPLFRPDRYSWGDALASREERLLASIDATLRPRFGQPSELHFVAPANTDFVALRHWYERRAPGWTRLPELDNGGHRGSGQAFGFSHGNDAFVLVWTDPAAESDEIPVTVQRYGASAQLSQQ